MMIGSSVVASAGICGEDDGGSYGGGRIPAVTEEEEAATSKKRRRTTTTTIRRRNCILRSAAALTNGDDDGALWMVNGPSRSGRTSLLLDLAASLAARAPCRCSANSSSPSTTSQRSDNECNCTAVLLLRPLIIPPPSQDAAVDGAVGGGGTARGGGNDIMDGDYDEQDDNDNDRFPLLCHFLGRQSRDDRNNIDNNDAAASTTAIGPLLRRIRVRHVSSLRDAYLTLLALQGLPASDRPPPGGGILVDDLDRLASASEGPRQPNSNSVPSQTSLSSISQLRTYIPVVGRTMSVCVLNFSDA